MFDNRLFKSCFREPLSVPPLMEDRNRIESPTRTGFCDWEITGANCDSGGKLGNVARWSITDQRSVVGSKGDRRA